MKNLYLFGVFLSIIAIVSFAHGGIHGSEAIGVGFNFVLIGINYSLWRIDNGGYNGVWSLINPLLFILIANLLLFNFLGWVS